VWKEVSGGAEEDREATGEDQGQGRDPEQGPAVTDQGLEKSLLFIVRVTCCHRGILPAPRVHSMV
jgi:hypothetical protein